MSESNAESKHGLGKEADKLRKGERKKEALLALGSACKSSDH